MDQNQVNINEQNSPSEPTPTQPQNDIPLNDLEGESHEYMPRWLRAPENGRMVHIKVFADDVAATTGDGKFIVFMPPQYNNLVLKRVYGYVTGASSSGALTIQIRNTTQAVDMLSTAITIDQSELSSLTAATQPTINTTNATVVEGDQIAIDVDGAGTSAEGLGVVLIFA